MKTTESSAVDTGLFIHAMAKRGRLPGVELASAKGTVDCNMCHATAAENDFRHSVKLGAPAFARRRDRVAKRTELAERSAPRPRRESA